MGKQPGLSWWTAEAADPPLMDATIGELLDQAATRFSTAEAVVTSAYDDLGLNIRWTFDELQRRANRRARGLISLGLMPGSKVAIWAPNVPEWLVTEFAVAKAGLVLVTVNPTYRGEELRYVLDDAGVTALFLYPKIRQFDLLSEFTSVRDSLQALKFVYSLDEVHGGLETIAALDASGDQLDSSEPETRQHSVSAQDVAQIQYTSGTTGRPKGAQLSHYGLINNARLFASRWQVSQADRWCNPMPLFHTAGCAMVTFGAVSTGACQLPIVWFDPVRLLQTVEQERATILETVPTMLVRLLDDARPAEHTVSSLRIVGTGGSPTAPELGARLRDEWHTDLRIVYGLTETSPLIAAVPAHDSEQHTFDTVGTPLPATEVRIVDGEGATTSTGTPGELWVRGHLVMKGYLNRPAATRDVIDENGWFRTGDVATMDDDGYLRIIGRLKDVIIRGGENIYPAEIEALLGEHPGVDDAQLVGVPDPYYGEEVCAALITHGTLDPQEVKEWLRQRVTHQKVPRYIIIVDNFPLTASGKVQKHQLREQIVPRLDDRTGS